MSGDTMQNVQYFEAESMRKLFGMLQTWQRANQKRFVALSIDKDEEGEYACIAITADGSKQPRQVL